MNEMFRSALFSCCICRPHKNVFNTNTLKKTCVLKPWKNNFCSTYGVKLIQKLHEVFLKLEEDLLTLKHTNEKRNLLPAYSQIKAFTVGEQIYAPF